MIATISYFKFHFLLLNALILTKSIPLKKYISFTDFDLEHLN